LKSAKEENSKRENANVDGDGPMGTMLHFGSTVSKEFGKAYLLDAKYSRAHDEGAIHIHDLDFLAMGTTTCNQIDLDKLFKNGFSTGHGHLRCPNDIMSYAALAAICIQANQNDQHGGQSIPMFDYYMAPGVKKTFKKQLKQMLYDYLDLEGFLGEIDFDKVANKVSKQNSIEFDIMSEFEEFITSEMVAALVDWFIDRETSSDYYSSVRAMVDNIIRSHKGEIINGVIESVAEKIMEQKAIIAMKPKMSELAAADKENVEYFERMIDKAIARKFGK